MALKGVWHFDVAPSLTATLSGSQPHEEITQECPAFHLAVMTCCVERRRRAVFLDIPLKLEYAPWFFVLFLVHKTFPDRAGAADVSEWQSFGHMGCLSGGGN